MKCSHPGQSFPITCLRLLLISGIGLTVFSVRLAAADPGSVSKGSDVFDEECADCHSLRQGKNKKGPSLFAVVGRTAGSVADYHYSDALKAGGFVWTPEKIDAYITHPRTTVPGGKMKYKGLDDAGERANVIAFLQTIK